MIGRANFSGFTLPRGSEYSILQLRLENQTKRPHVYTVTSSEAHASNFWRACPIFTFISDPPVSLFVFLVRQCGDR